ncbi:hypothetical protein [Nonomuraea sp. B19D2]|uniref:hypothetical protein n=1 Tax=Nonomuraea sp. B19D2 TaxID=3159561 RepID=UPI0032DA0406
MRGTGGASVSPGTGRTPASRAVDPSSPPCAGLLTGWGAALLAGLGSALGLDPGLALAVGLDFVLMAGCGASLVEGVGLATVVGVLGPDPSSPPPMGPEPNVGVGDTTTGSPSSGSSWAARTSPTDMNPAIAAPRANRINVPR